MAYCHFFEFSNTPKHFVASWPPFIASFSVGSSSSLKVQFLCGKHILCDLPGLFVSIFTVYRRDNSLPRAKLELSVVSWVLFQSFANIR